MIAKQNTARTFIIGPVLDADGAFVTDCVIADFEVSKNGATPAALNGSATLTHEGAGFYSLAATTSDFNTLGTAQFSINDTVNGCARVDFDVIPASIYDALVGGTEFLPVDAHKPNFAVSSGTLTVKKPDGTTTAHTKTVTSDPAAEPITGAS